MIRRQCDDDGMIDLLEVYEVEGRVSLLEQIG